MLNIKKSFNKNFFSLSLKGMSVGFFSSLILSSIILSIFGFWQPAKDFSLYYSYITAFAISLSISYYLKLDLQEALFLAGGSCVVAWTKFGFIFNDNNINFISNISFKLSAGDPLNTYIFNLISYFLIIYLKKFNFSNWKPIIFSFLGIISGFLYSLSFSVIISSIIATFSFLIYLSLTINILDIFVYVIFSLCMSFFLTAPISSAAIAYSLNLQGTLFIICLVSTSCNMISFATLSYLSSKKLSSFFLIGFATSMFQFYNSIKYPKVWIGIFITSLFSTIPLIILSYTIWDLNAYSNLSSSQSLFAGMGSSAMSSFIFLLSFNPEIYLVYIMIFIFCLLLPFLFSILIWKILSKKGIINMLHYQLEEFNGI